ncbi:MAG: hypothetical protein AAF841_13650 [Pseudomonadota bacterium]
MNLTDPFKKMPRPIARLPRVVRIYIAGCIAGFTLSAIFTEAILWFNIANIGHLVRTVEGGWLAAFVFFMFNGIVFSGVQTGIVIMSLPYPSDETPPRGRARPALRALSAIPARGVGDQERRFDLKPRV